MRLRQLTRTAAIVPALILASCDRSPQLSQVTAPADALLARKSQVSSAIEHVLLISIDGLHALDLRRFVSGHPTSTLARLSKMGTTFTETTSSKPSDSYPGLLAMVTGGTPRSTG